jgi:hypothetical protein
MPAKDTFHQAVRTALVKDGWTITHDPYRIAYGVRGVFVDLGAERTLGAERGDEKIAVEIKSFLGASDFQDFKDAVGQYFIYRALIRDTDPDRTLFLAVPYSTFETLFSEPIAQPPLRELCPSLFAYDSIEEKIVRWIP